MENTSMRIFDILYHQLPSNGLYPIFLEKRNGRIKYGPYKFGALGDSFYEYELKLWLQTGKTENYLKEMYDRAMDGVHNELLVRTKKSNLLYLVEKDRSEITKKMDELVCFMPGLLALGSYHDPNYVNSPRNLKTAKSLMYTCYNYFNSSATGLAPEIGKFNDEKDLYVTEHDKFYLLRPETIESMYILNYYTHDPIYKEWAYNIFTSIKKYCKTKYGYGKYKNVYDTNAGVYDVMESFFPAETLKYLYLIFTPNNHEIIDLSKRVYNTEAHPLSIFENNQKPYV